MRELERPLATSWIVAIGLALAALVVVVIYNGLVRARALVREGWSGVTVQLRRRADLIPNLVSSVKGYVEHERGLLETVTARRAEAVQARTAPEAVRADTALDGALGRLMVVAEAYPDLKADQTFLALQAQLAEIETELQSARRYYNATVRDLNTRIATFPALLIAGPLGFREEPSFTDDDPGLGAAPAVQFDAAR
ncbi:LemA family protein [Caulobacter sp. RHG1]|nr:LemA family protein [Caulobacter sp. RHG1]